MHCWISPLPIFFYFLLLRLLLIFSALQSVKALHLNSLNIAVLDFTMQLMETGFDNDAVFALVVFSLQYVLVNHEYWRYKVKHTRWRVTLKVYLWLFLCFSSNIKFPDSVAYKQWWNCGGYQLFIFITSLYIGVNMEKIQNIIGIIP